MSSDNPIREEAWSPSEIAALGNTVHTLSEAVTALADRLNALALRVALMGRQNDNVGSADAEAYLNRLSWLVVSAGDQMRLIQSLLQAVEVSAGPRDGERHSQPGARSWNLTNRPSQASD